MTLFTEGVVPFILALPIAYWGDRIHRAAWTGALVLIQSVGFFFIIIPHFSHSSPRVVEETTNVTHLSLYSGNYRFLLFISTTHSRGRAKWGWL